MDQALADFERERPDKDIIKQFVSFIIGEELFGVDILMVQEIIRHPVITPIPNAPDFIEGVINLRGNIIPVIDLRKRLQLNGNVLKASDLWILILKVDGRVTGFVVDAVTQVLKLKADIIKPPPDIVVAGLKSQYISGLCKVDERLLVVLDFNRILLIEEIKKLKNMSQQNTLH